MRRHGLLGRSLTVTVALVLGAAGTGCIGAPWAIPPVRASVGLGPRIGERPASRPAAAPAPAGRSRSGGGADPVLRVSLEPLQLVPQLMNRPFDVGVGYLYEPGSNGYASVAGPYLETAWVLFAAASSPPEAESNWARDLRPFGGRHECGVGAGCTRLSIRTRLGAIRAQGSNDQGLQVAAQLSLEHSGFARWSGGGASGGGRSSAAASGGAAWGEGGIGVYAEVARSEVAGARWWQASGGLAVRVPVSVGGFFAVCGDCMVAFGRWH
jgi:hypothetical protein